MPVVANPLVNPPLPEVVAWILWTSTDALGQGATKYAKPKRGDTATGEDYSSRFPVPRAGTLIGFEVVASGSPGAGEDYTLTVRVNGVNKIIVVLSDSETTGFDRTTTVPVVVGDDITLKMVSSAGATTNRYFGMSIGLKNTP